MKTKHAAEPPRRELAPVVRCEHTAMKVLVTGAAGFLGRQVVRALRQRGHEVRALVRPQTPPSREPASPGVEEFRADLCSSPDLQGACEGVQAVVHLAAKMRGDDQSIVDTAVRGTERLLKAMEQMGVKRMVLASSLSVYNWGAANGVLHEDSPLETRPETRDAYTTSKILQEQLARDRCSRRGIALTVLRPGFIWGAGREYPPTIGQRTGPFHVLIESGRQLPVVHVENCADAFAAVLDVEHVAEGTFNLIDHPNITVRCFVRDYLRRSGQFGVIFSLAYPLGFALVTIIHGLAPGPLRKRLPGFVVPARFEARYKPVQIDGARLRDTLGWRPPISYEQCLDHTYAV